MLMVTFLTELVTLSYVETLSCHAPLFMQLHDSLHLWGWAGSSGDVTSGTEYLLVVSHREPWLGVPIWPGRPRRLHTEPPVGNIIFDWLDTMEAASLPRTRPQVLSNVGEGGRIV